MRPLALVVGLMGAVASGCSCPAIRCSYGLDVSLSELPEEPGLYEVSATGEGTASCQFEIDGDGAVVEDDAPDACFGSSASQSLMLDLLEGEYRVALSNEDGELASTQVFKDAWSSFFPHGRQCGRCDSASVSLAL